MAGRSKIFLCTADKEMQENNSLPIFKDTINWLDRYFKGEKPDLKELSLAHYGNDFRQEVWKILCKYHTESSLPTVQLQKRLH